MVMMMMSRCVGTGDEDDDECKVRCQVTDDEVRDEGDDR